MGFQTLLRGLEPDLRRNGSSSRKEGATRGRVWHVLRWSETEDLLGKGGRGEPGPQWLLCGAQEQCWRSGSPQGPRPATGGEEKVGVSL